MSIVVLKARIKSWTAGMTGVLEIGYGDGRWSADVSCPWRGIDCVEPTGLASELRGCVSLIDATVVESWEGIYPECDCAMLIDFIEHLKKADGLKLLTNIEKRFKRVMLFTPLGHFPSNWGDNHPLTHKSSWFPEELAARGYLVEIWPVYHSQVDGTVYGAIWATREG